MKRPTSAWRMRRAGRPDPTDPANARAAPAPTADILSVRFRHEFHRRQARKYLVLLALARILRVISRPSAARRHPRYLRRNGHRSSCVRTQNGRQDGHFPALHRRSLRPDSYPSPASAQGRATHRAVGLPRSAGIEPAVVRSAWKSRPPLGVGLQKKFTQSALGTFGRRLPGLDVRAPYISQVSPKHVAVSIELGIANAGASGRFALNTCRNASAVAGCSACVIARRFFVAC